MTKSESDDLAAQIRTLPTIRREMIGELIGKQYVLDLVEAHLDRDRKMKAELADNLEVWCATCQKDMVLVTGVNNVKGWYRCNENSNHTVIIAALEATAKKSPEGPQNG